MSIQTLALNGDYVGRFEVTESEINFFPEMKWSEYRDYGNMVYFMFVENKLMKIGIAAGKTGWNARVGMYKSGVKGDATNRRILRVMKDLGKDTIHIYAVQVPKEKISFTNPLTGDTIDTEVEVVRPIEQSLTAQFLSENANNELPFCNQLT